MRRESVVIALAGCGGLVACATLWATPQVADEGAQLACVVEASTRAEADECRCRVRAQYPSGPQCDAGADR